MKTTATNNIRLGLFVLLGLALLVTALFFISSSSSFFSSDAQLKARFSNVNGLQEGNNVLFSGINAGTVKSIVLLNQHSIEVTLLIKQDVLIHIPKNALVSIGTEGLMGNKVVNIIPLAGTFPGINDGDYLAVEKKTDIDEMLATLSKTNNNIAAISEALKGTALRINNSAVLKLLENKGVAENIELSIQNINTTTAQAQEFVTQLNSIITDTKNGKGAAGLLLSDKDFAANLQQTMANIKTASENANTITREMNNFVATLNIAIVNGNGPVNSLLNDSTLTVKLNKTLDNLEKGTDNFNQDMEALKHNFLLKGYFKKLEKQKKKDTAED
ncbi:MlaD family protein [Flavobacterium subsaxonicum]|uniref:Mammalian cell entry protein n=1 Tax=Flavobacterium subsaxonicum WB 4.1-42 = DSM 21790 TaxID=1121898 RepID=A0A0A2N3S4_9FLAO|nr:MlaD family protein [Flavobacterium subsaxonicum]KGO95100.1 mammalian cell entry protein [Flavobacterium subsaxonicum WB 4.1-42 = DSM 21790]